MLEKILKLGDPILYEVADDVQQKELPELKEDIDLMDALIQECRRVNGFGRGIAAPQIGVLKRIVCLNLNGERHTLINPVLSDMSDQKFELWDDCMSFPNLLVRVKRHKHCTLKFLDEQWNHQKWELNDDLSELLQHECDHLDGILATQRAIDDKSFKVKL